jgi:hypothetical protein
MIDCTKLRLRSSFATSRNESGLLPALARSKRTSPGLTLPKDSRKRKSESSDSIPSLGLEWSLSLAYTRHWLQPSFGNPHSPGLNKWSALAHDVSANQYGVLWQSSTKAARPALGSVYPDGCAAAHALDVFGERWALPDIGAARGKKDPKCASWMCAWYPCPRFYHRES